LTTELDPQIAAAKEIVKGLKELRPVWNEILEQFGISKSDNFQGLIPLSILLYPRAKEAATFLHNMIIIQGQIMSYLETLGADIGTGIKTAQKAAIEGGVLTVGEGLP
jgi:hypothetical protein